MGDGKQVSMSIVIASSVITNAPDPAGSSQTASDAIAALTCGNQT